MFLLYIGVAESYVQKSKYGSHIGSFAKNITIPSDNLETSLGLLRKLKNLVQT